MASLELRDNGIWHIRWRDRRGKSRSQSTKIHTSPKNDLLAQKKLAAFELDLARGKNPYVMPRIGSLLDDVLNDYAINKRKSEITSKLRIEKHLRPWFGEMRADRLGADDWREYVVYRQSHEAANATINLERASLIRAFHLAKQAGTLETVPYIPRLKNAAPRSGFINETQLEGLCRHLPEYLRPFVRFAFYTGWRLSEIRGLQWRHVDFESGEIRLDIGTTKSGDGRVFPMTSELRTLLESTAETATAHSVKAVTRIPVPTLTPFVFTRSSGKPIKIIYASWRKAVKAIGMPWLIFHDLRRSAVINMDQRGVPPRVAMSLVGHKTMQVWQNYRRISKADLDHARESLEGSQSVRKDKAGADS
jgi:integrase